MKPLLFALFTGLALAQNIAAQAAPTINPDQVRPVPTPPAGDNWLPYPATCVAFGTVPFTCTIPVAAKAANKVEPFLNGVWMHQAAELPAGTMPNVAVVIGTGTTTITFNSPIPGTGDVVVVRATQ